MHRHAYMQAIHHTHKINLKTIIIKTYTIIVLENMCARVLVCEVNQGLTL